MPDYFDRMVARARGEAATARPPARTILEPSPAAPAPQRDSADDDAADESWPDAWPAPQRQGTIPRDLSSESAPPTTTPTRPSSAAPLPEARPAADARSDAGQALEVVPEASGVPVLASIHPAALRPVGGPHAATRLTDHPAGAVGPDGPGPADRPRRENAQPGPEGPRAAGPSQVSPVAAAAVQPSAVTGLPPTQPSPTPGGAPPQTIVRVSIGRIEVKATPVAVPQVTAAGVNHARADPVGPRLALDAYLERERHRR